MTGWFPSNYVQLVENETNNENGSISSNNYHNHAEYAEETAASQCEENPNRINETLRIKVSLYL